MTTQVTYLKKFKNELSILIHQVDTAIDRSTKKAKKVTTPARRSRVMHSGEYTPVNFHQTQSVVSEALDIATDLLRSNKRPVTFVEIIDEYKRRGLFPKNMDEKVLEARIRSRLHYALKNKNLVKNGYVYTFPAKTSRKEKELVAA